MADLGPVRGWLKVFLGYSSGVGKSYRMLDEGRRRRERGQDVVVGACQPRTQDPALAVLRQLPLVPMHEIEGKLVMDVAAILTRCPEVCLVDGMAYDNPVGSAFAHRWQEMEALLAAGISVIASVNLQFIAEYRDPVERLTGRRVIPTIPQALLLQADEIEIVDAPLQAQSGAGAGAAIARPALSALREMTLLLAADVVDRQLERYLHLHGITSHWGTQERILVCVTPWIAAQEMIASGQRNAQRFGGEWMVAHVGCPRLNPAEQQRLHANLALARQAGAEVRELPGTDFVATILPFAREHRITQIFVGHSIHHNWKQRWRGGSLARLIQAAEDMDIRVFPH